MIVLGRTIPQQMGADNRTKPSSLRVVYGVINLYKVGQYGMVVGPFDSACVPGAILMNNILPRTNKKRHDPRDLTACSRRGLVFVVCVYALFFRLSDAAASAISDDQSSPPVFGARKELAYRKYITYDSAYNLD
eukprot:scaffold8471_cov184-Amphora_coffeaeformis.AAC.12